MTRFLFLVTVSLFLTSFGPKEKASETYWVFCTTTGDASYASSCVQYKIDDWRELTQAWKLAVREQVGSGYNERNYNFQIKDRECSTGNVMYSSKYEAVQGRDCYIRLQANKGISVKVIALDY